MSTPATTFRTPIALSLSGVLTTVALDIIIRPQLHERDSRTSFNPKAGREFLKGVIEKNPDLRKHITKHIHFIKLIYALRDLVVHREMLPKSSFEEATEKWKANFITVDTNIVELITQCGDRNQDYEPMTAWGLYSKIPGYCFLEPYHFSKAAVTILTSFCNTFLHLLGFGDFVESFEKQGKKDIFTRTMERFREDSLGF